jgi:lactoylglutathione lyase
MFDDAFPIISTPDMQRALGFYRDLLDGEVVYRFPPEGEPGYVALNIGSAHLGLGYAPDAAPGAGGQRFALWVYADSCDDAVERLRAAGVTVTEEPADQPWGERVARVLDPDGNEVIVGQRSSA